MTPDTLILVADAGAAQGYTPRAEDGHLRPLETLHLEQEVPAGKDIDTDRPGRSFDSVSHGRSALERSKGPRRVRKEDFLRAVADDLHATRRDGGYERVVLIGPPRTLGLLRRHMDPQTEHHVAAEIHKDLTHMNAHDLEAWLRQNATKIAAIPRAGDRPS